MSRPRRATPAASARSRSAGSGSPSARRAAVGSARRLLPFGAPATGPAVRPAYAPPPGYTGPYLAGAYRRAGVSRAGNPAADRGSRLGVVALIAALGAAVLAPIGGRDRGFQHRPGHGTRDRPAADGHRLRLVGAHSRSGTGCCSAEISFWVGTALGVWAIVQGIIAIVTGPRARVPASPRSWSALLGVVVFAVAVQAFLTAGLAAGSGIGG